MCFVHFIFVVLFLLIVDRRNDLFFALLFSSCVCGLFQSTSWSGCNWFVCHVRHKRRQCFLCCFMLPRILEMGMEALCFWVVYPSVHTCIWVESFSDHTHTHTHLMALFPGLPRCTRKVKPIWILLKQETVSGSDISWAICKSAPHSRQITTPAPHHSVFTGRMPFLPPNQQRQSTEGVSNAEGVRKKEN